MSKQVTFELGDGLSVNDFYRWWWNTGKVHLAATLHDEGQDLFFIEEQIGKDENLSIKLNTRPYHHDDPPASESGSTSEGESG